MKNIICGLIALVISVAAFAKDQTVVIDGKNIVVTDVSNAGFIGNNVLHANDLSKGVYIMVTNGSNIDSRLPGAEKIIADVFRSYGIKIAANMEDSGYAIGWTSGVSLDMVRADRMATHTAMPNGNQVAAISGQAIGAALSAGPAGLVGYAAGALFNTDSKLLIQAIVFKDPAIGKVGLFGVRGITSSKTDLNSATVFYKLEKGKEAPDDIVLKMAVDQWVKRFVVFDAPPIVAEAPKTPETAQARPVAQAVSSGLNQ